MSTHLKKRDLLLILFVVVIGGVIALAMTSTGDSKAYLARFPYLHEPPCPFCGGGGPTEPTPFQRAVRNFNPFHVRSTSGRAACLANLKQIDGAIQDWAFENKRGANAAVTLSDLQRHLKGSSIPQCPAKGTYIVSTVSEPPKCNLNGKLCPYHSLEPDKFR
jgi:hypothetical protein